MADERVVGAVLQALSGNESGGDYSVWNKQGEPSYGKYQFLPATWDTWSKRLILDSGIVVDKIPQTPHNQEVVARYKVSSLLDQGYRPDQVASIWNSGSPDYDGKTGTNKYGNKYDVPGYVSKFQRAFNSAMNAIGPSEAQAADGPSTKIGQPDQDKQAVTMELYKRGLLPPEKKALIDELNRRGMLSGGVSVPVDKRMDTQTGAPYAVRLRVGGSQTSEDKLSTIRKTFPDAQPYEQDNFVYTDPKTGRPTLYNPPGFDIGDIPENTRIGAGMIGGGLGAMAGAGAGIMTGPGGVVASPIGATVGGGIGTALGLNLYDALANIFGGSDDTRDPTKMLVDYGIEGGAAMAGDLATNKILTGLPNAIKGIKNKLAGIGSKDLAETFDRMGISKAGAAGAITGNRAIQGTQSFLHDAPMSANQMDEAMTKTMSGVKSYADDLVREYTGGAAPGTTQDVGEAIQTGSRKAIDRFKARSKELYDKLYTHIDSEEQVPVSNVLKYLDDSMKEYGATPELGKRFNKGIIDVYNRITSDAGESGSLPFGAVQRLRSDIGELLGSKSNGSVDDLPTGQLKKLYSAIMGDLEEAVKMNGPEAEKAFDTASRYYRFNIGKNLDMLERIDKANIPEKVFDIAFQSSQKGGNTLYKVRRNLKPDEWDYVVGSCLDRMGKAAPGAQDVEGTIFSPNTFMTNWNKLSVEAKSELFGGTRYSGLRKKLDDLLRVSASLKDSEKMINRSKTGAFGEYAKIITSPAVLLGTFLGSSAGSDAEGKTKGAITGFLGATLAPKYAAKLITNEKFVDWLARGARLRSPSVIEAHIGRLAGLVASEKYLKDAVNAYLTNLENTLSQEGN